MKFTTTIFICAIVCWTQVAKSQNTTSNVVELHTNLGFSNDFESPGLYGSFSLNDAINMTQKSYVLVRSFGISLGKYFFKKYGIRVSIGQLEYGFDFQGSTLSSDLFVKDSYRVTYVDFGVDFLYRKQISENVKLLVNGGFHLNSDPSPRSQTINIGTKNSISSTLYAGLEYPMIGDRFFVNGGLHLRLPLKRYNNIRFSNNEYLPYFIGLKIGVNYQF